MFEWREEVIAEARSLGYVVTIGGRKRHLADIDSADWFKMAKSERQAVNSKVQGSAADIVRRAMLALRSTFPPSVLAICLQVHDEILAIRGPEWDDSFFPTVVNLCEYGTGFELDVPLVFEATIASSWAAK
jgi:DNA polymerase-1